MLNKHVYGNETGHMMTNSKAHIKAKAYNTYIAPQAAYTAAAAAFLCYRQHGSTAYSP